MYINKKAKKRVSVLKEKLLAKREEKKKFLSHYDQIQKEEETFKCQKEEAMAKFQSLKKKIDLYNELIVRSPKRLERDMVKNEAMIPQVKFI